MVGLNNPEKYIEKILVLIFCCDLGDGGKLAYFKRTEKNTHGKIKYMFFAFVLCPDCVTQYH